MDNKKNNKLVVSPEDAKLLKEYCEENDIPPEVYEEMVELSFIVEDDD